MSDFWDGFCCGLLVLMSFNYLVFVGVLVWSVGRDNV